MISEMLDLPLEANVVFYSSVDHEVCCNMSQDSHCECIKLCFLTQLVLTWTIQFLNCSQQNRLPRAFRGLEREKIDLSGPRPDGLKQPSEQMRFSIARLGRDDQLSFWRRNRASR